MSVDLEEEGGDRLTESFNCSLMKSTTDVRPDRSMFLL